jgi:hypothetical protein
LSGRGHPGIGQELAKSAERMMAASPEPAQPRNWGNGSARIPQGWGALPFGGYSGLAGLSGMIRKARSCSPLAPIWLERGRACEKTQKRPLHPGVGRFCVAEANSYV